MLIVRHLSFSFGETPLFKDIGFQLQRGERAGLVGPNGAGKTTLLRILAGEIAPPPGTVEWVGRAPRIGYLPQEDPVAPEVAPESGGERMRRRLARVLAARPEVLLLDEPGNHLDEAALEELAAALRAFEGAILLASHDRWLLDAVCTRILALDRGALRAYRGHYSAYAAQVEAERLSHERRYREWDRERRRLKEAAERQRRWAEKAHRDAGERDPAAKKKAAVFMKKALATERRLARHEAAAVPKPWEEARLKLAWRPVKRLPERIAALDGVTFTYAGARAPALRDARLEVRRGERLALVGPNGSGKTTVLRLFAAAAGAEPPPPGTLRGRVSVTPGAAVLWFRQEATIDGRRTPLDLLLAAGAPQAAAARTLLGVFGIMGDAALRPAGTLSPGERVRLAFALAIASGPDLLLLDEPTNHLDLPGREALEQALCAFPGTVVFASHDRTFRERTATRVVELAGGRPAEAAPPALPDPWALARQLRQAELAARMAATRMAAARPEERPVREAEAEHERSSPARDEPSTRRPS
ncbi:MAG: ABC-F family ATP-binding cassette domain-containing protein [Firmicutes bacterium]|nr:ABC-F family ATP-binding cassette domain-containing protein [Bacillota bacterium]